MLEELLSRIRGRPALRGPASETTGDATGALRRNGRLEGVVVAVAARARGGSARLGSVEVLGEPARGSNSTKKPPWRGRASMA